MRTETITLYKFDELSDEAKQKAMEWYSEGAMDYPWWDSVYDDFENICAILGIDLDRRRGSSTPAVYFRGFWSQGDGAAFEGDWNYAKGMLANIKSYAPEDEVLHAIARDMVELQRRHFYKLHARVRQYGHYFSMAVDTEVDGREASAETDRDVLELMDRLAGWLYAALENEYEYLTSAEAVSEMIRANEYEFTEDGVPA